MYYKDYAAYLRELFPHSSKVQKISVNAGFTCPNRDGTISTGGCIYCLNMSFTPGYCMDGARGDVAAQLERGREFFGRKYPEMEFLAYFQSFTNTFGSVSVLENLYRTAMNAPGVIGLVIGTRPDCIDTTTLQLLSRLNREKTVMVELGAETSHDHTLRLINRGHAWSDVERAARVLSGEGIHTGLHLIAGLPGEEEEEVMQTIGLACALPVDSLKLHQLQVLRGTALHDMLEAGLISVPDFTLERYLDLCVRIVKAVPGHICLERFLSSAPPHMVVRPQWGVKNHVFTDMLRQRLAREVN